MNAAGTCRFDLPAAISSSGGRTWVLLGETFPPPISGPMCKWLTPLSPWGGAIGSDLAYLSTLVRDGHSRGRPLRVTVLWLSVHPLHPNSHGWPSSVLAPGKYSSTAFPGNQGANLMSIPLSITCNLPLNPRTKPAYLILSAVHHTLWGVAPGPCFRLVSSPIH